MSESRVSPWKRFGHDRLYVNLSSGESVAWFDRTAGRLHVIHEAHREAALAALAPHVGAIAPPSAPPGPDLAANRPGDALRAKLDDLDPGLWTRLLHRLLGRRSETDSWRAGLAGERKAGAELDRLSAKGWRVLHSIPLPRDVDIDHLLIGPGGVFSVNTKHHAGARVWVGDHAVRIGGRSYPYPVKAAARPPAPPRP